MKKKNNILFLIIVTVVFLIVAVIVAISIGAVEISFKEVVEILMYKFHLISDVNIDDTYILTVWQLRLPRILMSLFAGGALAISGALFQSVFRNPICDPYILGVSSGASLGSAIAFVLGWDTIFFGVTFPALITAILTLLFILGISKISKYKNTNTLLLAGIAINFLISAFITLIMVLNQQEIGKIIFWNMGSLSSTSWNDLLLLFPFMLIAVFILFFYSKELNIMQLGTDTAKTLGVNIEKTTNIVLITSSLLVAIVVSICGVIGFIGLVIPHIVRLIFGNDNRKLFAYSLILGALFLLFADTVSRIVALPSELPVGSITALTGAPCLIYFLLGKKSKRILR